MANFGRMRATLTAMAMVAAIAVCAQFDELGEEQRQQVKRGVFLRAGILGAAGLVATQSVNQTYRTAGWTMFAGATASIFTVQIMIGDRVKEEPKRRPYFVKLY